jgi:uncharacterized protein (DUF488 family)
MNTLFTIGHSDTSLAALMNRLAGAGIRVLVDIRSHPESKRHPQFDEKQLRQAAEQAGMIYHWAGRQLGGLRKGKANSAHIALQADLRSYADYMDTADFERAANQLIRLAGQNPTALLCAEANPDHCHRSLIADYLTLQGIEVTHLLWPDGQQTHRLRPEVRRESAALVYDRTSRAS